MSKLDSTIIHGTLNVLSSTKIHNTISISGGANNINGDISNIDNGWVKLKDLDDNTVLSIDNKEIALNNELKVTTNGNGINVDGPIKENGILFSDTYLSLNSAQSGFKQLPLDSLYSSITARNGRLYTSGAFNNITDLNLASVKHYGDSAIITTPTNKFNAIISSDEIYTGPSFENLVSFPSYSLSIVSQLKNNRFEGEFLVPSTTGNCFINFAPQQTEQGILSFELEDGYIANLDGSGIVGTITNINNKYIVNYTSISSSGVAVRVVNADGTSLTVGDKFIIKNPQIVEGAEEKPIVPPQYTFSNGAISFDGTEGMNFTDYSYIEKGVDDTNNITDSSTGYFGVGDLFAYSSNFKGSKNVDILLSSGYTNVTTQSIPSFKYTDLLSLTDNGFSHTRKIFSFKQLLAYKDSLTQSELETELAKNLIIDGEVDVIDKIESLMRIGAVLGKRPKGDIQDNVGTTTVGDVWYDQANEKYYECKTATDETFIDLAKWEERSLDSIKSIGVQQTWQNMTSNRSRNTEYTNNTGMPIMVAANMDTGTNGTAYLALIVNGMKIFTNNTQGFSGTQMGVSGIIPDGSTYKIIGTDVDSWFELRG